MSLLTQERGLKHETTRPQGRGRGSLLSRERGLKHILLALKLDLAVVAPLAGGVD